MNNYVYLRNKSSDYKYNTKFFIKKIFNTKYINNGIYYMNKMNLFNVNIAQEEQPILHR